ncbi:unnamed protein product [Effrenium voratum]|nr:unnamed protein product [Effrenium voratum]
MLTLAWNDAVWFYLTADAESMEMISSEESEPIEDGLSELEVWQLSGACYKVRVDDARPKEQWRRVSRTTGVPLHQLQLVLGTQHLGFGEDLRKLDTRCLTALCLPTPKDLQPDEEVEYWSSAYNLWVPARVLGFTEDGKKIHLDVKRCAEEEEIRKKS